METLTTILHEMNDEQRKDYKTTAGRDEATSKPNHRRHRNKEVPPLGEQPYGIHPYRSAVQIPGEHMDEGRDQSRSGRVLGNDNRGTNVEENELRQRLHNIEWERDLVAACDPNRALELKGKVRRLAHVIDEMQGKRKPPSWRIKLDDESPFLAEIMGTVIPRDFRFPDLKYSEKSDPLVHIKRFNDITGV